MKKKLVSFVCWLMEAALIFALFQPFERIPAAKAAASSGTSAGVIAYVVPNLPDGEEIHLIEQDGSGDRLLFRTNHPLPDVLSDIGSLAWKPDASELAFSSAHENTCSRYESDIFAIHPDGTNYRRVTAPPACGDRAGLPTGTVTVPVYNSGDLQGPFIIYLEGAPAAKSIAIPPGSSTNVTFYDVSDYGTQEQYAVWMFYGYRTSLTPGRVDVVPGEAVQSSPLVIAGGAEGWGFRWPTYLPDGSTIATIFSQQYLYEFDSNSQALGWDGNPIQFDFGLWASGLLWAPTLELEDRFLYYGGVDDDQFVVRASVLLGNAKDGKAQELFNVDPNQEGNTLLGLAWLPDGSGFLYSLSQFIYVDEYTWFQGANLWEYSFDSGESTQLTNVSQGYTRQMSVSPDGSKIVFEYQSSGNWIDPNPPIDLYMMNRDGSDISLFVEGARSPAWSPVPIPDLNPVPALTGLDPSSVDAGGEGFTLTVSGSNFMNGSVVRWNGSDRATTYVSSTQLKASISAADIATAKSVSVTIFNPAPGGGMSNATTFSITGSSTLTPLYLPLLKH